MFRSWGAGGAGGDRHDFFTINRWGDADSGGTCSSPCGMEAPFYNIDHMAWGDIQDLSTTFGY